MSPVQRTGKPSPGGRSLRASTRKATASSPLESSTAIGPEKTTLAPSTGKRKRGRPAKATPVREQSEVDAQLGFRDIPTQAPNDRERESLKAVEDSQAPDGPEHETNGDLDDDAVALELADSIGHVGPLSKRKRGRPSKSDTLKGSVGGVNGSRLFTNGTSDPHQYEDDSEAQGVNDHHAVFKQLLQEHDFTEEMAVMKDVILGKLTGRRRLQLVGVDEEYKKIHQLVEQTVTAGEGNSALVIGARGSGKTTVSSPASESPQKLSDGQIKLVETVISDLSVTHPNDFHVVRLNGFIHTDDKLALRETWRQLGREMDVDDDTFSKVRSLA